MTDLKVEGATDAPEPSPLVGQIATGKDAFSKYEGFDAADAVTEDSMAALASLAQDLLNRERELAEALKVVTKAKLELADVQEIRLPTMMEKHGLKKFTFKDKTTGLERIIEFIEKWAVSVPPISGKTADPNGVAKRRNIYAWLHEIGSGSIVKKTIDADVGTLDDLKTVALAEAIKKLMPDIEVSIDERVEGASLTALISRMKDAGKEINKHIITKPIREARVKGNA